MSARRRPKPSRRKPLKSRIESTRDAQKDLPPAKDKPASTPTASDDGKPKGRKRLAWMSLALLALIGVGLYWGLPAYWIYRGEDSLKAGRYTEADQFFEKAGPWPSQRKASILGQVKVARFSGNPARALALLSTARYRGVSSDQLKFERSLLDIQSGGNESNGNQASELLVRFPERGSEIMEAVVKRDVQRGQTELALQHVNDWLEAAPKNARALSYKAELLATAGDMEEAETLFRSAIEQDPHLRRARHGLAKLLKYVGQYKQAVDLFEIEISREPSNVSLRLLRCDALLQMQRSDQAIEGLLEVLELDELNFPARHSLASQLAKRGEHARVIEVLTPLLDEFTDDASINYLLASAYSEQGDTQRADQHMQQYLDGRKRLDELVMLTQSLSHESPDQTKLLTIANDYLKYQWDVAEPWIVRAIQNAPSSRAPYLAMAEFQRKKGDLKQAAQYQQAAALHGT